MTRLQQGVALEIKSHLLLERANYVQRHTATYARYKVMRLSSESLAPHSYVTLFPRSLDLPQRGNKKASDTLHEQLQR